MLGCSSGGDDEGAAPESHDAEAAALPALHAVRGDRPGVFDVDGRQVVLRGVNLNGLAEYARADPDLDPTVPVTDETWDQIADEGFNVVRLLVSWSRLEPERGEVDDAYVDEVRSAVRGAARRGLYTVVDMHQDAWGPFVATPASVDCPPGREPANGWDGAPEWATPSADAAGTGTCRPADGYDLLNEPGHGQGATAPTGGLLSEFPALGDYYARAIGAIREGESAAGVEPRPIYFEHSVAGNPPPPGFSDDPGLVFAPHIYGGSIVEFLTVDQNWDAMLSLAEGWQTSIWVGEYGWWDDPAERPELVERVESFAAREDRAPGFVPVGSAWWQWNNGCGDPHQVTGAGVGPQDEVRQYRVTGCASGVPDDLGVVPEWRRILTRPAVRFAPGWITDLASEGATGTLDVRAADATPGADVELWVPGDERPRVGGSGIAGVESARQGGGWRVSAEACAAGYRVVVGPGAPAADRRCP